jgi:hypothetical protein
MKNKKTFQIKRRSFLSGLGAGAAANFIRPLIAQAQSATGSPQRLLMIHRPCGTDMTNWFPTGGTTKGWTPSQLLSSFSALQNDMVVMKGMDCPRVQDWLGDKHGAGMIAMISPSPKDKGATDRHNWPVLPGYTQAQQDDTNAKFFTATDLSIDQLYLQKIPGLQGTMIPSLELTSSTESADSKTDPCLRVVSYSKAPATASYPSVARWPEVRPDVVFKNVFGSTMMNMDANKLAQIQAEKKSVLDYLTGDLQGLQKRLPGSQVSKIDQHLTAIRQLETNIGMTGTGRACDPSKLSVQPLQTVMNVPAYDASHYQASIDMMNIIKTTFLCDLTRVITFTYGWGNSTMHFFDIFKRVAAGDIVKDTKGNDIVDTGGHHDISHNGGTGYTDAQYIIDKFYCNMTARLLNDMKNTPDGMGNGSLLDNTLVVFWNECSIGNPHDTKDMPVAIFGGKFLKLQGGSFLQYGDHAHTMADFWVTTSQAWGYKDMTYYSAAPNDPMWNKGTMAGIYG